MIRGCIPLLIISFLPNFPISLCLLSSKNLFHKEYVRNLITIRTVVSDMLLEF